MQPKLWLIFSAICLQSRLQLSSPASRAQTVLETTARRKGATRLANLRSPLRLNSSSKLSSLLKTTPLSLAANGLKTPLISSALLNNQQQQLLEPGLRLTQCQHPRHHRPTLTRSNRSKNKNSNNNRIRSALCLRANHLKLPQKQQPNPVP
jgi:hypothetical protein